MATNEQERPVAIAPGGGDGVGERLVLRLFVAGDGPNSTAARANLKRLLEKRPAGSYTVEVVDCLVEPLRAIDEGVFVTPTLLRLSPPPRRTVVGSLSETSRVMTALALRPPSGSPNEL
jgi:circadian clock protein KaiB